MLYWLTVCSNCEQGRLFVFFDETAGRPYLHCEECEYGFRDPTRLEKADAFLTLLEDFDAHSATREELARFPVWSELELTGVEEEAGD